MTKRGKILEFDFVKRGETKTAFGKGELCVH